MVYEAGVLAFLTVKDTANALRKGEFRYGISQGLRDRRLMMGQSHRIHAEGETYYFVQSSVPAFSHCKVELLAIPV
jgi:hypothetical protein